eukprot:5212551-Ditylum_brightwellii.AAC.1
MATCSGSCFSGAEQVLKGLLLPCATAAVQEWWCPLQRSPSVAENCVVIVVVGGGSGLWFCVGC